MKVLVILSLCCSLSLGSIFLALGWDKLVIPACILGAFIPQLVVLAMLRSTLRNK